MKQTDQYTSSSDLKTVSILLIADALKKPNASQFKLEGGDDGATMTSDGIHYSAAGLAEVIAQWSAIIT